MKIAACSSITSARRARLTSIPISSRSTAAVESRSSHSAMARPVRLEKLRAKARVDCARGPSLPSMLMGRPSTKPTALRSPDIASSRAASALNALRWMRFDAGRQPAVGIGDRDADGLGAEVEADQGAALGPVRRRRRSGGGWGRAWSRITRGAAQAQSRSGRGAHAGTPRHLPRSVYRIATGLIMLCTPPLKRGWPRTNRNS